MCSLSINSIVQLKIRPLVPSKSAIKSFSTFARIDDSQRTEIQQQQTNLSVLRFTFGIPGLNESLLPRWIGYGFGSLLLLNHFGGFNTAPAQLRTEALGLSLAAFSTALPYFGRFLKGANPIDRAMLPQGSAEQVFVMSNNISDTLKEDLAWATYVLLRNTNTIAVLISAEGELCARGYWNTPDNLPKTQLLTWFQRQIELVGLFDLKDTLYFPQTGDSSLWEMLLEGTRSVLIEPVLQVTEQTANEIQKTEGFVLVASNMENAYSDKDRAWIRTVANKFRCNIAYQAL